MDLKIEKQWLKKYKWMRSKGVKHDLMCFGCECGIGWAKILDNLFDKIDRYLKNHPKDYIASYKWVDKNGKTQYNKEYWHLTQVKEKFGTLRVYTAWVIPQIDKWINKAERQTEYTCEQCGKEEKPNTLKQLGRYAWIHNMCNMCWKKHLKERKNG